MNWKIETADLVDPSTKLVMCIVQTAYFARLKHLGTLAIEGKVTSVAVYAPSDAEYDAVKGYLEHVGIIPKSEVSLAVPAPPTPEEPRS